MCWRLVPRQKVRFAQGDITKVDLPPGSTDAVLSTHRPCIICTPPTCCKTCFRRGRAIVGDPGGAVYLTDFTRLKSLRVGAVLRLHEREGAAAHLHARLRALAAAPHSNSTTSRMPCRVASARALSEVYVHVPGADADVHPERRAAACRPRPCAARRQTDASRPAAPLSRRPRRHAAVLQAQRSGQRSVHVEVRGADRSGTAGRVRVTVARRAFGDDAFRTDSTR